MTGKEAYKELVEKLGDMLSQCEADDINPFLVVIYQNINRLEKLDKKLAKYKRAFEIIKKYKMIYDLTDYETSQEEKELLEELMKDEK